MCAVCTPAVNVNALLTECAQTEITVGQRAAEVEGSGTTDPQSSHTSSTADLLAKTWPTSLLGQILSFVTHSSSFLWLIYITLSRPLQIVGKLFFIFFLDFTAAQEVFKNRGLSQIWNVPGIRDNYLCLLNKSFITGKYSIASLCFFF